MHPRHSPPWWAPRLALLLVTGSITGAGCDFFRELESAPGTTASGTDTDTGSTSTGDTDDGLCEIASDDRCLDQDTVASCGPADGILTEVDCATACGGFVNFSCVATGSGLHACWCVEPGAQQVLTCVELESCLGACDPSGESFACADQCFGRADASTIRIFGALVHCAEVACEDTCRQHPAGCQACLEGARTAGESGCSLPRAVCDDDRIPDEPWS
jgi:hypothetical protein